MAAITKRLLHLRPSSHYLTRPYPYTHHHFSSSSDHDDAPKPQTSPSLSSSLNDVRASLQNAPSPPSADGRQPPRSPFSFPSGAPSQTPPPSGPKSGEGILRQRLAEFRSRSAQPPSSGEKYISMSNLYQKNFKSMGEGSGAPSGVGAGGGRRPFDSLRESLSNLEATGAANSGRKQGDRSILSSFTADLNLKTGGKFASGSTEKAKVNVVIDPSELGKKLQLMRPEKRKGKWFSLQELSNRLKKVKAVELEVLKVELKKREQALGGPIGSGIVESLKKLEEQSKQAELQSKQKGQRGTSGALDVISGVLNKVPEMTGPPKDHLIDNYFHPDNMSSAEKLKLELAKVRDEFKMSESDCGSARVQVAQLTTKIKHLSTALHKKDKHSRRGLKAMVERRKKLLKYLRRTDWDSYSLVLSKLGLRDNPDVKA